MSGIRTRIAPTPSGYLHAGNAVNFLITHQLARAHEGAILLRIDDLDAERTRPAFIEDIFDSLRWLGISWDEGPGDAQDFSASWSQSLRVDRVVRLLDGLRENGALYACSCSRRLSDSCECKSLNIPFDAPEVTWRLRIPDSCPVLLRTWPAGEHRLDLRPLMPDPVLRQRNGSPAYQLASLADDVHFNMNMIVRGADLLPSSACQLYIASLLGLASLQAVRFLHHPLLTDAEGHKLSKSEGASSLRAMRQAGRSPDELQAVADQMLTALGAQGL